MMGLDNKLIFPEYLTKIINKENPTANYTREADGTINRIDGRSEIKNGLLNDVGILNSLTNQYDIDIITSKEYNFIESSIKTISIEQPLRKANNDVYDSIYKFTDGNYYLFKKVGTRGYQIGDEANTNVITDGITTNYDLGRVNYTETQLVNFDPNISFLGTTTTISCTSVMPSIEVQIPIDYAYNESKKLYNGENIVIDAIDMDSRKKINITSIEGQTFANLLEEPLETGEVIMPIELEGRECIYDGGLNTSAPLIEIQGDTYINLLESKIEKTTLKPTITYSGDVIDGYNFVVDISGITFSSIEGSTETISNWINIRGGSTITVVLGISAYWNVKGKSKDGSVVVLSPTVGGAGTSKLFVIGLDVTQIQFQGNGWTNSTIKNISGVATNYNLNNYDRIAIDKIKGNTKLYHEIIDIANPTKNLWTRGNPVLQEVNDYGAYGDTSRKNYLGTAIPIYIGNVPNLASIYFYLLDTDGNKVSTTFSVRAYDKELKFTGITNLSSGQQMLADTNKQYILFNINGGSVVQQEGLYKIIITTTQINAFPTAYIEADVTGVKTFPIQSVGKLHVDGLGKPILDINGNEQYKINIISGNKNLASNIDVSKFKYVACTPDINNPYKVTINGARDSFIDTGYRLDNGKTYCVHSNIEFNLANNDLSNNVGYRPWFLNTSAKWDSQISTGTNKTGSVYFTVPSYGNYYLILSPTNNVNGNIGTVEFKNLQVEYGSNKTEYIQPIKEVKPILLPQPLKSVANINDMVYWNSSDNSYKLLSKIKKYHLNENSTINTGWGGANEEYAVFILNNSTITDLDKPSDGVLKNVICNKLNTFGSELFGSVYENGVCVTNHPVIYIKVNIKEYKLSANNDVSGFKKWLSENGGMDFYYQSNNSQIIETNITEQIILPCYNEQTYIYTSGTSSHDETNLPPIENLKGNLLATTFPLSTTAYVKPNTKYTIFMDTNCEVNYNLGGLEGSYLEANKKTLLTTPSTLTNSTLTLLGEGNIGNVTLLEGDYTNSYIPKKFINDAFSVGDLQSDGSYKVDIISSSYVFKSENTTGLNASDTKTLLYEHKIINSGYFNGIKEIYFNTILDIDCLNANSGSLLSFSQGGKNIIYDKISQSLILNELTGIATTTENLSIKIADIKHKTRFMLTIHCTLNKFKLYIDGKLITELNVVSNTLARTSQVALNSRYFTDYSEGLGRNVVTCYGYKFVTAYSQSDGSIVNKNKIDEELSLVENKFFVKSVNLPCQLMKVGNIADRLYWDKNKDKMCIEKRISDFITLTSESAIIVRNRSANRIVFSFNDIFSKYGEPLRKPVGYNNNIICNNNFAENSMMGVYTSVGIGYDSGTSGLMYGLYVEKFRKNEEYVDNNREIELFKKWLDSNKTQCIYELLTPQIIETDITQPINIDLFEAETKISTTSTVEPNIHMRLDALSRPVTIEPSTRYYIHANVTGDIEIDLGGSKIQYTASDTVKEIITPNSIIENTISFVGRCNISNVMLRVDNRGDINYFNGKVYSSKSLMDGSFETSLNITPIDGTEPTIVRFITTKPLKYNTSIVHIEDTYKYINELGEQESIIIDGIVPTSNLFKVFKANGAVPAIISVVIPYRSIRPLNVPTNISFNNYLENDNHTFVWNTDVGVEGHKFYYKNNLVATINSSTPKFTYPQELEGEVEIIAFNTLTESEPLIKSIVTLPNRTEVIDFDAKYINGEYKIVVKFNDNSNIKKGYKFIYSIDNEDNKILDIPITDNAIVLSQSINVPNINDNMTLKINTYNDVGSVEITPKKFYLTPTPKWSYLTANSKLMFRIVDKFNFRTNYNLLSVPANLSNTNETKDFMGSNEGNMGLLVDYLKDCNQQQEYKVSVVMDDETFTHIPCKPFNVSKNLDLSIIAPKNFTMEWLEEGVAKFSWDDNYSNDERFEFNYSLNNGVEQNVIIQSTDENKDINGKYFYIYRFAEYSSISAKVRMIWELNSSEYTENKQATFVEVTGLPPSWVIKKYNESKLVISWEAQSYVNHYEVKIECEGSIEVLNVVQDMFNLDLSKYRGKYVSISIKTHFTTGLITEYSNSTTFKPVINDGIVQEVMYSPIEIYKNDNVGIYSPVYDRYTSYQRIIGKVQKSNLIYLYSFRERLRHEGILYNHFNSLINEKYLNFISVKTENIRNSAYLNVVNYTSVLFKELLNSLVYTSIYSKFTNFLTIQKLTIVCIGDSITSGHPGFWAESMTGIIEHQYPYWLNKRLNNQYNVINKGFGSDRTQNVLARMQKDVIDLHPQYCIIQVGTNDIYWGQAEANDNKEIFNKTLESMKGNIMQCVQMCFDNGIVPIIGNLIPRTQAVAIPLVKYGIIEFNKWITEYSNNTEGLSYIDFFNAGKDKIPATPLEDPKNPYALNPLYDGDSKWDNNGNIITQGAGIHLNAQGYRIMAETIPLHYFKTTLTGIKMYLDADCTQEEKYNKEDSLYPFYEVSFNDLQLGRKKTIIRYLKNIGDSHIVFSMYQQNGYNIEYKFENEENSSKEYVSGVLLPDKTIKVIMTITPLKNDSKASITLYIAGRQFTQN